MQAAGSVPNPTLVALQVVNRETLAVTVARITLPGGAEVLVTPSSVAALGVIAAPAAPGHAASTAAHAAVAMAATRTHRKLRGATRCTGSPSQRNG
jgi:hypothetical protein